jgi:hypothetical protein
MILVKLSDYNLAFQIAFVLLVVGVIWSYIYERKNQKSEFQKAKKLFLFFALLQALAVGVGHAVFAYWGNQYDWKKQWGEKEEWRIEKQGKPIQKEWKVEEKYFGFKPFRLFLTKTHRGNIEFLDEQNRVRKKIAYQKDQWEEFDYFYGNSTQPMDTFYIRKMGDKVMIQQVVSSGKIIQSEKLLSPPEAAEWEKKMGFQ